MLHFRPRSREMPPKLHLHILHQMARNLDMSHICGVKMGHAGTDIVMLQNPCCVEVVHEALIHVVLGDALCGLYVGGDLLVCISGGVKISP